MLRPNYLLETPHLPSGAHLLLCFCQIHLHLSSQLHLLILQFLWHQLIHHLPLTHLSVQIHHLPLTHLSVHFHILSTHPLNCLPPRQLGRLFLLMILSSFNHSSQVLRSLYAQQFVPLCSFAYRMDLHCSWSASAVTGHHLPCCCQASHKRSQA